MQMLMKLHFNSFLSFFRQPKLKSKNGHSINFSPDKIRLMTEFMEGKQPFLQIGYSIRSLANELNVPSYQLSAFLNRQLGVNFNDYLNRFRVRYSQELIQEGVAHSLNLKGLSKKCGFNNRNSFTTAFKKFTGHTPSDYVKNYQLYQMGSVGANAETVGV